MRITRGVEGIVCHNGVCRPTFQEMVGWGKYYWSIYPGSDIWEKFNNEIRGGGN